MPLKNSRKLTGTERADLINQCVNIKNINPNFGKTDLHKMLESLGFARAGRTLDRLMADIISLHKNNPKGWHLDQSIDWQRNDILYSDEIGLESRFIPVLRSTEAWYHYNFAVDSKFQFPVALSYRWLRWANYFLQSIAPFDIKEVDIFVVAQMYAVRSLNKSLGKGVDFSDLEAWITARPWEGSGEKYLSMIDAGAYAPLLKLATHSDPNITIEKIGISFIANAYMNLCDINEIKDLPESATWKLPSQQQSIFVNWCKENNKEPGIEIKIPNIKETLKVRLGD